jgi:hypothetical protein
VAEQGCLLISIELRAKELRQLPAFTIFRRMLLRQKWLSGKCWYLVNASGSDKIRDSGLRKVRAANFIEAIQ